MACNEGAYFNAFLQVDVPTNVDVFKHFNQHFDALLISEALITNADNKIRISQLSQVKCSGEEEYITFVINHIRVSCKCPLV